MDDLYQILGVNNDASPDDIRRAYTSNALREHPDKGGNAQRMALLIKAYETLSDPIKRKNYDQEFELFNAFDDTEIPYTPSGCLPTAGVSFSKSFRQQHAQFVRQCHQKPLVQNHSSSYLKAFCSELYSYNGNVAGDLFSFIKAKGNLETKLEVGLLSPEKSVEYFTRFLQGYYFGNHLKDLSRAFYRTIKQLETSGNQVFPEFKLYCGIYEILLVAAKEKTPTAQILCSLHKIIEYVKHNTERSMSFMVPLLQSKYFRSLFSQALHYYWLSEESVVDASYTEAFNGQAATERLIERLKSLISASYRAGKSNDPVAKSLRHVRLLLKLEQDLSKSVDVTSAIFYREKAFHLLDWLPSLQELASNAVIVNTLLQIGATLQRAAAQETNPILCMADEKLAAEMYNNAVCIAHHATPDVGLYAGVHSVKGLISGRYADSRIIKILEACQHQGLWLADLFPFYQAPQPNADLFVKEDKTLVLMRQLLRALIDKIDEQNDPAEIDHSYVVRVFYQAYEACLKNWYDEETHDSEREEQFRQRLMQELLISKQWTIDDVNYNLNAPQPLTDVDEQGWTCPISSILSTAKKVNAPTYKTIHGARLNFEDGEINFILDYCQDHESDYNRLLTPFDLMECIQRRSGTAFFSLDLIDSDMPYHPFNKIRFQPSTLHHSQLLRTMFMTDYLLKFLTVGQEVQRRHPYELRSLDAISSSLPDHLKKVINDFHASSCKESWNRFWIESEGVELAIDYEELSKDDNVLLALGNIRMVVKHHKMEIDAEGKVVDKEDEDEGWDCYVLSQEQKQELYNGKRVIADSALIIIEASWELIFWENHKATHCFALEEDEQDLNHLSNLQRDSQEKVKTKTEENTVDSESLRQIYRIVLKAAGKVGMPHRYSPEFVFAQEFTKYYDDFAVYLPEFGRLRELSKLASLVNVMAQYRAANQEEIRRIRRRLIYKQFCGLQSKRPWHVKEHDYWQTTRQELNELTRKRVTEQFENWRSVLSQEKIEEKKQEVLTELRRKIGTLNFTRSSPEIRDICDKFYEMIKSDYIHEYGFLSWVWYSTVTCDVYKEAVAPQIPNLIAQLRARKKAETQELLLKIFEDGLAELSKPAAGRLVEIFLEGDDEPLRDHLVWYERKQTARKIKELFFPEPTIYTLDRAMNNSLFAIDEVVTCESEKAFKEFEQVLKKRLSGKEKLENSFTDLGFGDDAEEVNLEGTCSWVPASVRHDRGHSRTVYGGVFIAGLVDKIINRDLVKALGRQTTIKGKQAIVNNIRGTALNRFSQIFLEKLLSPNPRLEVVRGNRMETKHGIRVLDLLVLEKDKDGNYILGGDGKPKPLWGIEIKSGDSPYARPDSAETKLLGHRPTKQGKIDEWTEKERPDKEGGTFPVTMIRIRELKNYCKLQ